MPLPSEPLDRFLARAARLPRAAARRAIHERRVAVNGVPTQKYHRALAAADRVACDGVELGDPPDDSILVCHKPAGYACSHAARDAPLIYELVPERWRHPDLQTVGRLDRDTTGLLLLTHDGRFLIRVADPQHGIAKRYRVRYEGALPEDAVARCAQGLALPDDPRPCLPAQLEIDGPGSAWLSIREGRHHQVKRMFAALGCRVLALHREMIGGLELPADLAPGAMRPARPEELQRLGVGWWWLPPGPDCAPAR
ncbi:MAG: pseudouridine synthase [Planctomycetota bacterium]|nr:pseudouridine synthase [Planctomycetota bacterium]MCX8040779.1 pseudouridine synthase [Planctomycetota bacterium]